MKEMDIYGDPRKDKGDFIMFRMCSRFCLEYSDGH